MTIDSDTTVGIRLASPRAFDDACHMVVEYLSGVVPMGAWFVTRVAAGRQTVLVVSDRAYGLSPGAEGLWSQTMCRTMVTGQTPRVVPDTSTVPLLESALDVANSRSLRVGAYVGTPIVHADGELFGTVVGIDPAPQPSGLDGQEPLLDLLSSLLSAVLDADTVATDSARALERAVTDSETDPLTGLLNRRGWERWLQREEDRFRRFGDPATVVMFDLDGLKSVNDTEGHEAGDAYLRRAATTLRGVTRHGEPVARLGGDEFGLVAGVGADDVETLVQRLQSALDEGGTPCSVGAAPFSVATGFGGACLEADAAMNADKRARRAGRA
jgi:diguanylate cyclase